MQKYIYLSVEKMTEKQKKIKAKFFLSVGSRYREKLEPSLPALMEAIKKEDGVVESVFSHGEPQLTKDYWTTFIEAELTILGYPNFFKLCVKMLPMSVEVLEPEEITLTLPEIQDTVGNLMQYTNLIRREVVRK